MSDIEATTLTSEQEEAMHTPNVPEPDTEAVPEPAPKRKRRTKAEMEAARAAEAEPELTAVEPSPGSLLGATREQVAALNIETPPDEIAYRPANFRDPSGKQLAYIDARYVMDVLDQTVGPENWSSNYSEAKCGDDYGVECTITVQMQGYGSVSKTDVGVASTIESLKGAYSDAFKRAAVHFGIARDLYDERMAEPGAAAPVATAVAAVAPAAAVPQTIAQATETPAAVGEAAPVAAAPAAGAGWVCPIHGAGRIQPAGISKRTGKAYSAFWVCDEPGCRQTGGDA